MSPISTIGLFAAATASDTQGEGDPPDTDDNGWWRLAGPCGLLVENYTCNIRFPTDLPCWVKHARRPKL